MSLTSLSLMCRGLAQMLDSGVPLLRALKTIAKQQPSPRAVRVLNDVELRIRTGSDLATALREHEPFFPSLAVDMLAVADQTGALPEVLTGLANHYENLVRLRRTFVGAIAWPILQLVAAIGIIGLLIFIMGLIGDTKAAFDPVGLGLRGSSGALIWFGGCAAAAASLVVLYFVIVRGFGNGRPLHGLLLKIPVVGHCLRSFAVARFSWAYALTQQAGMEIKASVEASLSATDNGAFIAQAPLMVAALMEGEDFAEALAVTGLFPTVFVEQVRVGETSGTVPETLMRLGPQLEEDARRSLSALTTALGVVIWLLVASLIIFFIFRIALFYVNMLNDAAQAPL